jgi:hypothetical protein
VFCSGRRADGHGMPSRLRPHAIARSPLPSRYSAKILHFAHQGTIGWRHLDQQTEQAWCLTLVSNAIITWTTEYLGRAVEVRRAQGLRIDDDMLAHISPVRTEHVHLVGSIPIDIDREVAVLDQAGYRPLRP